MTNRNSVVLCPDCKHRLATKRMPSGNLAFESSLLLEDGALFLICAKCGGRKQINGVLPVLLGA